MDSVNLRKNQMVADPLEDATYNEMDSCADHESISRASQFSEYQASFKNGASGAAAGTTRLGVARTPRTIGGIEFDSLQINSADKQHTSNTDSGDSDDDSDDDDKSFGTMTSGLTTDFTEHDELLNSDDEEDDELDQKNDEMADKKDDKKDGKKKHKKDDEKDGKSDRERTRMPGSRDGSGTRSTPDRAKASNSSGAAVPIPAMPRTGMASARPTQTPNTWRPSKPIAQASR